MSENCCSFATNSSTCNIVHTLTHKHSRPCCTLYMWEIRYLTHSCGFQPTLCTMMMPLWYFHFPHMFTCICAFHESIFFFLFYFNISVVVHVQKDLFKWITFYTLLNCAACFFLSRVARICIPKGFSFDTNEYYYVFIQHCYRFNNFAYFYFHGIFHFF